MAVPEATIYKDHGTEFWKYDVWFARQFLGVNAITDSAGEETFSNRYFWLRVFTLDTAHHPTASLLVKNISHLFRYWQEA